MKITVKELLETSFAAAARSFPGVVPASEIVTKKTKGPSVKRYGRNEDPKDEPEDEKDEKNESAADLAKAKYEFLAQKAENKSDEAKGTQSSDKHLIAARAHVVAAKHCDDAGYIQEHLAAVEHHLNKFTI